jgi:hypothetical protein
VTNIRRDRIIRLGAPPRSMTSGGALHGTALGSPSVHHVIETRTRMSSGPGPHDGGKLPAADHEHPHPHEHSDPHEHPHRESRDHPHTHEHPDAHGAPGEEQPKPSEVRPTRPSHGVVVDIGDGVGALVLHADADREWLEPEIHPIDEPDKRQHVWVLERLVGSGTVFAAVFPSLPEGRYGVCAPDGVAAAQEVEIVGGTVTEARWL